MKLKVSFLTVALVVLLALVSCGRGTVTPTSPTLETVTATPVSTPLSSPVATPTPTPPSVPTISQGELSASDIVAAIAPSVVHVQTEAVQLDIFNRPVPVGGVGTGEILDNQGHILTNNHVIEGAQRIVVTLSDGRAFEAQLIGGDAFLDLAVLHIDVQGLVPIPLGQSSTLRVGDRVIAIGHALNLPGGPTVTGGLVSALDRSIDVSDTITMQHLIQTDAAINPGNSGGPLVNTRGELVGINTAKLPSGEGIGFAIAIDPVRDLIQELIDTGQIGRGFLGVSISNISESLAMNYHLPVTSGIIVVSVAPGSPAEAAGLLQGDIILSADGDPVENIADLDSVLIRHQAGSSVDMEIIRGQDKQTISVVLGERPS